MAGRIATSGKLMLMWALTSSYIMAAAPDGTPEEALVEMALASKPEAVEKHLPESFREALHQLSPEDRTLAEQKMLVGQYLKVEGDKLVVPDDGSALLVIQSGQSEQRTEIHVKREINGGSDALLELEIQRSNGGTQSIFIWMRLEADSWRVAQVDMPRFSERVALDQPEFVEQFRNVKRKETDGQIASVINTLLTALGQFATAYPEVGFPEDLGVLGPAPETQSDNDADPNEAVSNEHAGLLTTDMAMNEFSRDGYTFRYELLRNGPNGDFTITARPAERGRIGVPSYFADASGVIRSTEEDRDPTVEDEPVR